MKENIVVSICCQTYNHVNYIEECLNGFLMQKTNFKFEILLRDDASTDGTTEIVKKYSDKYPDIINPLIYNENQYQKGISPFRDNVSRAKGKYIAICEGDDYWTDPLKLQKQVDFLEANPEYGMVHTDFYIYNEKLKIMEDHFLKSNTNKSSFYDLLTENNFIGTLTTCFRKQLFADYFNEIKPYEQNWLLGDLPLWLYIANKSKIHFINEITAVYRKLNESASNFQNYDKKINFEESVNDVKIFFYQRFSYSNIRTKKRIKFLFSTNKLRINVFHYGSLLQFISLFMYSLYLVSSIKQFLSVLKLGLLKLRFLVKR